jgi:hypothetical protein
MLCQVAHDVVRWHTIHIAAIALCKVSRGSHRVTLRQGLKQQGFIISPYFCNKIKLNKDLNSTYVVVGTQIHYISIVCTGNNYFCVSGTASTAVPLSRQRRTQLYQNNGRRRIFWVTHCKVQGRSVDSLILHLNSIIFITVTAAKVMWWCK